VPRAGPGKYCGDVTRRVKRHGHRVRVKTHRCYVPPFMNTTVTVTFATT
jgi:hypothetical protein